MPHPRRPMPGPRAPRDLHAMVGVGADARISQLRYAYEQAMADAARRGDFRRARSLSAAYDALPATYRRQVYDTCSVGTAMHGGNAAPTNAWGTPTSEPRHRRGAGNARRMCGYAFGLVVVVLGIAAILHHRGVTDPSTSAVQQPRGGGEVSLLRTTPSAAAPAPTTVHGPLPLRGRTSAPLPHSITPATIYTPGSTYAAGSYPPYGRRYIPFGAPVNAAGFVIVFCPPGPRAAEAYTAPALPGSVVSCTNGAAPMLIKGNGVP